MTFTSSIFIFAFFPICLIVYFFGNPKFRNIVLLLFSIFFYAWGGVQYAVLILVSAFVNYFLGVIIDMVTIAKKRKQALIFSLVFNIGILSLFKYFNFFISTIESMLSVVMNSEIVFNAPIIPLPIGISFFTFQIMSYVIDVYRDRVKAQKSFVNLCLYIMMFPQLIAGPIVRYIDVEKEIVNRVVKIDDIRYGVTRFIYGFAKKIILSNVMGELSDLLMENKEVSPTLFAWVAIICYALQIFFDFSAYSDMAIGMGRIFGFHFLENFNYPYISRSVQEFWRRWHISLSSWFKDYLYIPLGGNRKGSVRTYINLMIVFFVTGLWHGASWNFIVWGLFHGCFLAIERTKIFSTILNKTPKILRYIYTMTVVLVGWVFFDIIAIKDAFAYILSMFSFNFENFQQILLFITAEDIFVLLVSILFCTPIIKKLSSKIKIEKAIMILLCDISKIMLFLISIAYMLGSEFNPFIYFRF